MGRRIRATFSAWCPYKDKISYLDSYWPKPTQRRRQEIFIAIIYGLRYSYCTSTNFHSIWKLPKMSHFGLQLWCFVIEIEWVKRGWSGSEKVAWLFLFKHKPCLKITTMDKLKEHIFSLISKRRSLCLQCDFMSDFQTLCFYDGVWVIPQLVWFFVIKTLEILQVKSFRLNFWLTALGDLRGFRGAKIQIFGFAVEATRFSINAQLFSCSHSLIIFKVTSCPLAEKWLNFMKVS